MRLRCIKTVYDRKMYYRFLPVCSLPLGPLLGELPGLHLFVKGGEDLLHAAAALTQQECLRLLEPSRTINMSTRAKMTHKK
jgi:hypothetical protein